MKCIDCNKQILGHSKHIKRCKKCYYNSRKGIGNPMYGRKGKKHPNWKGGKPKCPKCGKVMSNYSDKICLKCQNRKGKNNSNYKDGKTLKNYYCKDCGKLICLTNVYNGNKRCKSCAQKGKLNHRYGKISHGKWGTYKGIRMRSSYEIAYAKWCDKNNIKWLYESKTFDLGDTTYTPDFYLPKTDEYIEVKGYWRKDAIEKFTIFKITYPEIDIKIKDKDDLLMIGAIK